MFIQNSDIYDFFCECSGQGRAKSGHLPYRDSKLTRILQNSLGGNARTAIICTMSPAQAHTEQSRNTLFFATQAKEVTNTAQVNMVMNSLPRYTYLCIIASYIQVSSGIVCPVMLFQH